MFVEHTDILLRWQFSRTKKTFSSTQRFWAHGDSVHTQRLQFNLFFFFGLPHRARLGIIYICFISRYYRCVRITSVCLLAPFRSGKSLFCVCRSCVLSTDFPRAAGTGWQVLCCRCAATIVLRVSSTYALLRSMIFVNMDTVQCEQHDCHLQYSWKMWNTTTTKMLWIVIFVFFFCIYEPTHGGHLKKKSQETNGNLIDWRVQPFCLMHHLLGRDDWRKRKIYIKTKFFLWFIRLRIQFLSIFHRCSPQTCVKAWNLYFLHFSFFSKAIK